MSLPLDEPLHAKFLRRPYAYGLSFLFQPSALASGVSVGLSVGLAIVYLLWSGTIGQGDFTDRYVHWGDYPGFWLGFYWHSDAGALFAQHEYLRGLQSTTPVGIKGLYFLAAQLQIPFPLFQGILLSLLAVGIAALSCSLTLSILPAPLAGVMASFLSLQSLWSSQIPLVGEPKSWGYLGLLLCFCALNYRGFSPASLQEFVPGGFIPHQPQSQPFIQALRTFPLGRWLRSLHWPVLSSIMFLGLFAPTDLFLVFGVFGLQVMERLAIVPVGRKAQTVQEFLDWSRRQQENRMAKNRKRRAKDSGEWQLQFRSPRLWDLYFPGLGLMLAIGVIYGFQNTWGEAVLSRHDMLQQPAFYGDGLWSYFYENPWQSWLSGERSGFVPPLTPPLLWSGLVLPLWLRPWGLGKLPLLRQVQSNLLLLGELFLVSIVCFVLAHALVLQLGWPQDFLWISHRLGLTIASSLFLTAIVEGIAQSLERSWERWWGIGLGAITLVVIVQFGFIHLTPPANALPSMPSHSLYDRLQPQTSQSQSPQPILLSTLAFRDQLDPVDQETLDLLQTIVPFYFTPTTLIPYQKSIYKHQQQQLKDLIQAEYLAPRSDFLAWVDRFIAETPGEPLWLLERQAFTPENWAEYSRLQHLYPTLNRKILQKFQTQNSAPRSFLQTLLATPGLMSTDSCHLQQKEWVLVNLSDRCLPR